MIADVAQLAGFLVIGICFAGLLPALVLVAPSLVCPLSAGKLSASRAGSESFSGPAKISEEELQAMFKSNRKNEKVCRS